MGSRFPEAQALQGSRPESRPPGPKAAVLAAEEAGEPASPSPQLSPRSVPSPQGRLRCRTAAARLPNLSHWKPQTI